MLLLAVTAAADPGLDGPGALSGGTLVTVTGAALVAFLAGLAFSRGVLRQLLTMVSLAVGAAAAWYVFSHRDEVFGSVAASLSTDRLLLFSAGAGLLAFFLCKGFTAVLAAFGVLKLFGGLNGWHGVLCSGIPSARMTVSSLSMVRRL